MHTVGETMYYETFPGYGSVRLPWPMTLAESIAYVGGVIMFFGLGSCALVVWGSFQLIPPSLWRLAPLVAWVAMLKLVIAPRLNRALRPKGLLRRYEELAR